MHMYILMLAVYKPEADVASTLVIGQVSLPVEGKIFMITRIGLVVLASIVLSACATSSQGRRQVTVSNQVSAEIGRASCRERVLAGV